VKHTGTKSIVGALIAIVAILAAAFFLGRPLAGPAIQTAMKNVASEQINGTLTWSSVDLTPGLNLSIRDADLKDEKGRDVLKSPQMTVEWSLGAFLRGQWNGDGAAAAVTRINVTDPVLCVIRDEDNTWNVQNLLRTKTDSTKTRFYGKILIHNGTVRLGQGEKTIVLEKVNGQVAWDENQIIHGNASTESGSAKLLLGIVADGSDNMEIHVSGDNIPLTWINSGLVDLPSSASDLIIRDGLIHLDDSRIWKNGSQMEMNLKGALQGADLTYRSWTVEKGYTDFVISNGTAVLKNVAARVNDQVVRGSADVNWENEVTLAGHARTADSDLSRLLPEENLSGKLTADVDFSGTMDSMNASGTASVEHFNGMGYALDHAYAAFDWSNGQLTLSDFLVKSGTGAARGKLSYNQNTGYVAVQAVSDRLNVGTLAPSYGVSGLVSGTISAEGIYQNSSFQLNNANGALEISDLSYNGMSAQLARGTIDWSDGKGQIDFNANGVTAQGMSVSSLSGTAAVDGDHVHINSLDGILGDGYFHASGDYAPDGMNLAVSATHLNLENFSSLAGVPMSGTTSFTGTIRGTVDNPAIDGTIHAENGSIHGLAFTSVTGSLSMQDHQVSISNLVWNNGSGSHTISGTLGLNDDSPLDITIKSSHVRIEDLLQAAGVSYPVTGWMNNEMHITGTLANPECTGSSQAWNGSVYGELYQNMAASYEYHNGVLTLNSFSGNALGGSAFASGTVSEQAIDLDVGIVDMEVGSLVTNTSVNGTVTLRGHVDGTLSDPHFVGRGESRELRIGDAMMYQLSANVEYRGHTLFITDGYFYQGGGSFTWSGSTNLDSGSVNGQLMFNNWNMAEAANFFQIPLQNVSGIMSGGMTLKGTLDKPDVTAKLTIDQGHLGEEPIANGKVDISYLNGALQINEFNIPVGDGLLAARGSKNQAGDLDIEVAAMNMDMSWIPSVAGMQDVTMGGELTSTVRLTGTTTKPNAEISIGIKNPSYGDYSFDEISLMGTIKGGVVNIQQGFSKKGPYKASLTGTMPVEMILRRPPPPGLTAAPVNLDFNLDNADLNALALFFKPITAASGPIQGHIKMYGTWDNPLLGGKVTISDGSLTLATMSEPVTQVNGELDLNGEDAQVNLSAALGGGTVSMSGVAGWDHLKLNTYKGEFHLHAPQIQSVYYTGAADCDLSFEDINDNPGVKGTVSIHDATMDIPMSMESGGNSLPLFMDVEVTVGDRVRLYNKYFYDLGIKGNIHAMGPVSAPITSGRVNVERGVITYLSNKFNVTAGDAIWGGVPDSFLPVVHLEAVSKVGHYNISMKLDGPPGGFRFDLSSEPALNDSQIMTLLTVHTDPNSDSNDAAQGALFNAGLQMVFSSGLEDLVKDYIGLDFISVTSSLTDYYDSSSNQDDSYYYIKIGKYLFNDFMLTATTGINNSENSVGFHYDLSHRIGLSGWVDSDNDKYIGMDWKFNF
jgi:translocation and assembly module TamB